MTTCPMPNLTSLATVEGKSLLPAGWKADLTDLATLDLTLPVMELIRRTTSRLPQDIIEAVVANRNLEAEGSRAANTLDTMLENITLADEHVSAALPGHRHGDLLGAPPLRRLPAPPQGADPQGRRRRHGQVLAASQLRGEPVREEPRHQHGSLRGRPSRHPFRGAGGAGHRGLHHAQGRRLRERGRPVPASRGTWSAGPGPGRGAQVHSSTPSPRPRARAAPRASWGAIAATGSPATSGARK